MSVRVSDKCSAYVFYLKLCVFAIWILSREECSSQLGLVHNSSPPLMHIWFGAQNEQHKNNYIKYVIILHVSCAHNCTRRISAKAHAWCDRVRALWFLCGANSRHSRLRTLFDVSVTVVTVAFRSGGIHACRIYYAKRLQKRDIIPSSVEFACACLRLLVLIFAAVRQTTNRSPFQVSFLQCDTNAFKRPARLLRLFKSKHLAIETMRDGPEQPTLRASDSILHERTSACSGSPYDPYTT